MIHSLVIDRISLPEVAFTVRCSRGTYVRTLADDIGEALGVGAHLTELRRTASGSFCQQVAMTLDELSCPDLDKLLQERLISIRTALAGLLELNLSEAGCKRIRNGITPVRCRILEESSCFLMENCRLYVTFCLWGMVHVFPE
jgi:tRNA pseudouridine55 synthase